MAHENQPQTPAEAAAPAAAPAPAHAPSARPTRPSSGPRRPFQARRKVCRFCAERIQQIDYKQIQILRAFMTERGKILSRRITGNCAKHQRMLTRSIKRARNIAILQFSL